MSLQGAQPSGRRGFTLVEALVALTIMAVLATLAVAGMSRVRERMNATHCVQNLGQIGVALMLFAQEHNGCIPARNYAEEYDGGGVDTLSNWHRRLGRDGYVATINKWGDSEIFYCPSGVPNGPYDTRVNNPLKAEYRYGMRGWVPEGSGWAMHDRDRLLPLAAIKEPSDFFLVVDSYCTLEGTQGYFVGQGQANWRIHLRHNNKANALFADGHVEAKDADYFQHVHERQSYGGNYNGKPFYVWPAGEDDSP